MRSSIYFLIPTEDSIADYIFQSLLGSSLERQDIFPPHSQGKLELTTEYEKLCDQLET